MQNVPSPQTEENCKKRIDSQIWSFMDLYVVTEAGQLHPLHHHV